MSVANAGGYTGLTSAMGLIPELYAKEFNVLYWAETLLPRITTGKFYEGLLAQGDKVYVPTAPSITTAAYSKGQSLTVQTPSSTPITLTVDKARYFNIALDDVDEKQSHLDISGKYLEVGMRQMMIDIETEFFLDMVGKAHEDNRGTAAGAISEEYDLGDSATSLEVLTTTAVNIVTRVRTVLAEQNAFKAGEVALIVPAWFRNKLINSELKQAYLTGDDKSVLRTGLIGSLDGMEIYESNLLPTVTDNSGDVGTYCFAFNKDAVSYIAQLNKSEKVRSTESFQTLFRSLMVYDWGTRKPEGLVELVVHPGAT